MRALLLPACLATLITGSLFAQWETVRHGGHDYVTARSIKDFYGFTDMRKDGKFLVLENKVVTMKMTIGGKEVLMNNVKFLFEHKVIAHEDRHLVSRVDLSKLIDPVLRPGSIHGAKLFQTVVVDAGHGGEDAGAVNQLGKEKDYTLKVAHLLKKDLEAKGFKVVMTRKEDLAVSLADRAGIANRFDNAIFISLHFNSDRDPKTHGIETFALSPAPAAAQARPGNRQDSANIALATAVHASLLVTTGRPDRGIRRGNLAPLTTLKHPAIRLEGGYLSHPEEARLIHTEAYQEKLSRSITEGLLKFRAATTKGRR